MLLIFCFLQHLSIYLEGKKLNRIEKERKSRINQRVKVLETYKRTKIDVNLIFLMIFFSFLTILSK